MASGQSMPRARQAQHYSFTKIFRPTAPSPSPGPTPPSPSPSPNGSASASASAASSAQAEFFRETCLPMVRELLTAGQSGLYCTYGVTNSGKSYTIHGGATPGEAGVLPRTLDTIFNSLDGLLSESPIVPVGLCGVQELGDASISHPQQSADAHGATRRSIDPLSLPAVQQRLQRQLESQPESAAARALQYEHEGSKVKADRNYRYAVFISYLEVYNEKLYDLLDAGVGTGTGTTASGSSAAGAAAAGATLSGMSSSASVRGGMTRSESVFQSSWSLATAAAQGGNNKNSASASSSNGSGPITLTRRELRLVKDAESDGDPDGQCKYVAGLKEHRVRTAAQARELIKLGERNRAVFGTMANRASSRSHGVFTVRVIREHGGGGETRYSTSRMSIVDLAGSERLANTQLTDEARMKEAGSINKSLMTLGFCVEMLRGNQAKAQALLLRPPPGSTTRGAAGSGAFGKSSAPEIVPFSRSKLTMLLKPYFVGEGRTVMIITANPYDGCFYQNAHVMKFSANVKDVQSSRSAPAAVRAALPRSPTKVSVQQLVASYQNPNPGASTPPISKLARAPAPVPAPASARAPAPRPTPAAAPMQLIIDGDGHSQDVTIIEESDSECDDSDSDLDGNGGGRAHDPLVDRLFDECELLRQRLYLAEMRCQTIEQEVRDEMADLMQRKLREMAHAYQRTMREEAERNDDFVNRKIDLLTTTTTTSRAQSRANSVEAPEAAADASLADSSVLTVSSKMTTDDESSFGDASDADASLVSRTVCSFFPTLLVGADRSSRDRRSRQSMSWLWHRRRPRH